MGGRRDLAVRRDLVLASDILAGAMDRHHVCLAVAVCHRRSWQEMIFPEMIKNWTTALCGADTYRTAAWNDEMIVSCVEEQQGGTREDAWTLVHSDVMLPSTSSPPFSKRNVLKYLSRTVDYFYSAIGTTAPRGYLQTLYVKNHRGVKRVTTNVAGTHFTIKISAAQAQRLAVTLTLVYDTNSFEAVKDATVAVFKRLGGGGDRFIKSSQLRGVKPDLSCLLGDLAVVCMKIG